VRRILLALLLTLVVAGCDAAGPGSAASDGAADGFAAPDFTLEALTGGAVSLAELRGRPVLIDFWATWCAPCVRQIPVLNAFTEKYGERIPVLGISVDVDADAVGPFAAEHGVLYRILLGDEGLARDYGALGFPTLYVVRPDGTVHSSHVGVASPEHLDAAVAEWVGDELR
jgi:cytochrome c biogenesis protein CcmG/thiol:disulfide interchange protein DsbE